MADRGVSALGDAASGANLSLHAASSAAACLARERWPRQSDCTRTAALFCALASARASLSDLACARSSSRVSSRALAPLRLTGLAPLKPMAHRGA
jgi:hypothetical protein